jgi:hypothetical protein
MKLHNILEGYKELLKSVTKESKIINYDIIKKIPVETHKSLLKEYFISNKEELGILSESFEYEATIEGYVSLAKEILKSNYNKLVESIKRKVSSLEDPVKISEAVDYLIDMALIYETFALAFDESFAKKLVYHIHKAYKEFDNRSYMSESYQVLKRLGMVGK